MLAMATTKEVKNPTLKKTNSPRENEWIFLTRSNPVAANIVGIANKKENSTIV